MQDYWKSLISELDLKDKYFELSKSKRQIVILLAFVFFSTAILTITVHTELISMIINSVYISILKDYLMDTPLPLLIIIIISFISIIWLLFFSKKEIIPLKEIDVEQLRKPDLSSNVFEITLANISNKNVILKMLLVEWKYFPGHACSISQSTAIKPVGKYIVELPLDTHITTLQETRVKMRPMIEVPAKTESGPGIVQFIVQLHYDFVGKNNYHPNYDWDISYSLSVIDEKDRKYNIFYGYDWRSHEELRAMGDGTLDEYLKKLESNY